MSRIYWYAPFDNAGEMSLARAMADEFDDELTLQSCSERFGNPLDPTPGGNYELVRDLPPPAGEGGTSRSPLRRFEVAFARSHRRAELIRSRPFDLLHLHTYNPFTDWYAIQSLTHRAPALVQSIHNVRPHDAVMPRWVETALLKRGYGQCPAIVVAHQRLADQVCDEFRIPSERVHVVPIPVQSDRFSLVPVESHGDERLEVLFFGTLRRNKGIPVLLQAMQWIDVGASMRLTIAGRGDEDLEHQVLDAASRDERMVAEVGFVEEERRRELFAESDVIVLPYTEFAAQSGVLHDAYAAGRPVIASRLGALGDEVKSERCGWLVAAGDPVELASKITELAKDRAAVVDATRAAAALANDRAPERIAGQLHEIYERLLANGH